ncbi:MAG: hypothetical protein J1E83_02905 [Lachnospiraceae bacterium]|nr:hypothetical protein [Lachnospiraceae bacterium]
MRENLYKKIQNYLIMGLWEKMPNELGAKIVEMSAYAPLITATAIDYIRIPIENIFVLEDEKVSIVKKAISVKSKDVKHTKMIKDFPACEDYINQYGLTFYKKKVRINSNLTWLYQSKTALGAHGINVNLCPAKEVAHYKKECFCNREDKDSKITNTL